MIDPFPSVKPSTMIFGKCTKVCGVNRCYMNLYGRGPPEGLVAGEKCMLRDNLCAEGFYSDHKAVSSWQYMKENLFQIDGNVAPVFYLNDHLQKIHHHVYY
ncbi:hypothetical protein KY285_033402 [Solanum tuberosum]|nr:hypothetical protein KY285_033402 [Solanum tuberosum]